MIYRVFSKSREYLLTGTPGIDLKAAFKAFLSKLSTDKAARAEQLRGVLEALDATPGTDDLETEAFIAVACDSLDLVPREMTEVNLWTDSVKLLVA